MKTTELQGAVLAISREYQQAECPLTFDRLLRELPSEIGNAALYHPGDHPQAGHNPPIPIYCGLSQRLVNVLYALLREGVLAVEYDFDKWPSPPNARLTLTMHGIDGHRRSISSEASCF